MNNFFTAGTALAILGCLILGSLYAWLMYYSNRQLDHRLKIALTIARALAVSLIAFLLFAPLIKKVSHTLEKPLIVIAQDNSLSVVQAEAPSFNAKKYQNDLQQLSKKLSEKFEVKTYSFGDSVRQGLNFSGKDKTTNANALITQINDELLNRNVGAIILATDGIFNRGGNPAYELNKIKSPVYTIALGDTLPKKDALVANVNYNNLVYLDNDFTLDIQVQATDSKGEETRLTILEDGNKIKEEPISINSSAFVKDIAVKLKASKMGMHKYTISIAPLKNEITTRNNSQTIFVEVIDGRQKILLAAASPHPDLAVIRQAATQNKHYEVDVVLADELDNIDLSKYNLVILHQLPSAVFNNNAFFNKLQQSKLSCWFILGAQSNVNALNQIQKSVQFVRSSNNTQEVFGYLTNNFTLFNIELPDVKQLQQYDPLISPTANFRINGANYTVLNQRIGRVNTESPLWFFMTDDDKKLSFLLAEGIWKWKLEEAKSEKNYPFVNELINKTIQYLSVKDDKRKFKVYPAKSTFEENENIVLNATLYNDAYEPVNTPEVNVVLKNTEGKTFNYAFSKTTNAYHLDAGMLPKGTYSYTASTTLGEKKYEAKGLIYINETIVEYQQTTANHQLLSQISVQSGGKMYLPDNLLKIADEIEKSDKVKTISYEDRKFEELISLKWLFILILLLLSAEWFLRKRNGEI
ncbi:vWA domain-containing protein [Pedobacter montanisoli]|uniref:VWA domain-containing protein n=1 Tax=Pedobacter montanisoli TaxID=2923277 RepID=A0ABS9ZWL0_9SPHI|nr:hypothetical protein [Pedobacter montanisoli]MCJ0742681.1 hypothetical protein [Pedobacter montanisoli]